MQTEQFLRTKPKTALSHPAAFQLHELKVCLVESQRLFYIWGITQEYLNFLITAPDFVHYSSSLRGGKYAASQT